MLAARPAAAAAVGIAGGTAQPRQATDSTGWTCCFSDVMCVRGDARTALQANYILHLLLQAKGRGSNPGHSTALPCPAAPCGVAWAVSAQSCSQMCPSFPGQGEAGSPRALKNISHLLLESDFSKELPSAPSCGTGGIRI